MKHQLSNSGSIDNMEENPNTDISAIIPCNYCGTVYDGVDSLQSHLHRGCSLKRKFEGVDTEKRQKIDDDTTVSTS